MARKKAAAGDTAELRRWCVEQAVRWPTVTSYGSQHGAVYSAGGGLPTQTVDADVVGRAERIRKWVLGDG